MNIQYRVTRLGDLSPFGRLFKALGDNLFGPNRPNFWQLFGRFLKVGQNLKFLCYKIIFKAVNFQKKYFLKYFEKKLGNFFSKKDPKYAFLATKTSKNWVGDFGRLFSLHWAIFYSNHLVTLLAARVNSWISQISAFSEFRRTLFCQVVYYLCCGL